MKRVNIILMVALVLIGISLSAWVYQMTNGLIVTDMRNSFSWGLYIATFAFFVGIAAGGLIVSSSVYIFNIEQLKPFTRIASLTAFASIVGAGTIILPDMGRVDRLFNMFLYPDFRSPLVWDVIVVSAYMVITFLSVYFQLLPDWQRENRGFLNSWTKKLPQEKVEEISKRWSKRIAIIGLPIAVLIHTITALIFSTQASRSWWNTPVLPPDFIAMAVASGTALVLVVSLLVVGKERFSQYKSAFKILAQITAGALVVHFFLMYVDILMHWWWGKPEELNILSLIYREYGFLHWTEVLLPGFTMIYFFTQRGTKSPGSILLGSILLFIGVFAHRLMLMYPAFNQFPLSITLPGMEIEGWHYPIASGEFKAGTNIFVSSWPYIPTVTEIAVTLLPFGLALLIISFMVSKYNFLADKKEVKISQVKIDNNTISY